MTSLQETANASCVTLRTAALPVADVGQVSVPCLYCRWPIPAVRFSFWSDAKRLVSADCPACERRVTLATSTWRRWLKAPASSGPAAGGETR
jgi:hypothetical protein